MLSRRYTGLAAPRGDGLRGALAKQDEKIRGEARSVFLTR